MRSRILKLAVLGAFFVFAGGLFFISTARTDARDHRAATLEKVRGYKTWKEVTKSAEPAPGQPLPIVIAAAEIDPSTFAG